MNAPAPGWHPDPTGRHAHRYWDGSRWTDDVADAGITATDPLYGPAWPGGEPTAAGPTIGGPGPGDEPTTVDEPTPTFHRGDQPTQAYPLHEQPTQAYPTGPGPPPGAERPGSAVPPAAPAGKRPSPALIVGIVVLVVALIGGIAFAVTRDGDDTTAIADREATSTTGAAEDGADDTGSDGTTPTTEGVDAGLGSDSAMVEMMADEITTSSGGAVSHEEALCMSEVMLDHLGLAKLAEIGQSNPDDPFATLTPAEQGEIFAAMFDCAPEAMMEAGVDG